MTWVCDHAGSREVEPREINDNGPCPDCGECLPCDHIWVHYEAGDDASATLNAPEGTAKWSEPVFVCLLCDLIQPEPWVENGSPALEGTDA